MMKKIIKPLFHAHPNNFAREGVFLNNNFEKINNNKYLKTFDIQIITVYN